MRLAVTCYGMNWEKFVLYGIQDDTEDCGERVAEFIKSFIDNYHQLNEEKQFVSSIN
jgi:hypothetical protein